MIHEVEILKKIKRYCSYQERCHSQVRKKLFELGARASAVEKILSQLIEENFLNESRFACSFVRGKFYSKKWGRLKIVSQLHSLQVSENCIQEAIKEIDEQEYRKTINHLSEKYLQKQKKGATVIRDNKLFSFLRSKGYESEIILDTLKK